MGLAIAKNCYEGGRVSQQSVDDRFVPLSFDILNKCYKNKLYSKNPYIFIELNRKRYDLWFILVTLHQIFLLRYVKPVIGFDKCFKLSEEIL